MPAIVTSNTNPAANVVALSQINEAPASQIAGASTLVGNPQSLGIPSNSVNPNSGLATTGVFSAAPIFSTLPKQIAGFVPLMDCTSSECRDTPQLGCYYSPAFGLPGTSGSTYQNDCNTFGVTWSGYTPQFVIQKRNLDNSWTTEATVTNNDYGIYQPLGSIVAQPTFAVFTVNWGDVISDFGQGIYRIGVNGGITTYATNASLTIVIPNTGFPKSVVGTFTIGTTVMTLSYNGSYSGYLTYLASLITSSNSPYTAITTANGITITTSLGNKYNGIKVSQILTNTVSVFTAYVQDSSNSNVNPSTIEGNYPPGFVGKGTTDVKILTSSQQNVRAIIYPQTFRYVTVNNNNVYDGVDTYTQPVGADPNQTFSGAFNYRITGNAWPAATSYTIQIQLYKNGVGTGLFKNITMYRIGGNGQIVDPSSFATAANPSGAIAWSIGTNVGGGLVAGDKITIGVTCIFEFATGQIPQQPDSDIQISYSKTFWTNGASSSTSVTTNWGTLTGGVAGVTTYSCAKVSKWFQVKQWDCEKANGTVKFEINTTGTIGDKDSNGTLFNLTGINWYDSNRVYGKFGWLSYKYEEVMNEYGQSNSVQLGTMQRVRDKAIPNYKFKSKDMPLWVHKRLAVYGFMSSQLLVSDYNTTNSDWDIKQIPIIKSSGYEPKYHDDKGQVPKKFRNILRRCSVDSTHEAGIQSIIMSTSNLT